MDLEARQNALEVEMNTAKDTIWRLTNRIYNLEKEVGLLKNVIQKATKTATASVPPVSAKLAEIIRRKQTLTSYRNIQNKDLKRVKTETALSNQSKNVSSSTPVEYPMEATIKNEPVSDDAASDMDNEMPLDAGNMIQGSESKSSLKRHANVASVESKRIKVNQSDQSNSSDSEGSSGEVSDVKDADFNPTGSSHSKVRNSVRVGRPKCSTWKYFRRIKLPVNKGPCRFLAVCKICKIEVSGRADRLKPHIIKCLAKYRARGKKIPGIPLRVAKVPKKVIPKKESKLTRSTPAASAKTASDFDRTFTRGRKKAHQVWQYYTETVSESADNGGERFMAMCKSCGQEVSRKTDRLQGHVKRCMGIEFVGSHKIRVNCKKESHIDVKPTASLTDVRITSSQSVVVNPPKIPAAKASEPEQRKNVIEAVLPVDELEKETEVNQQQSGVQLHEFHEPPDEQFNINAKENHCQSFSIEETRTS